MDLANSMLSQSLFGQSMFGAEEVERIFADRARVQRMLDFEAALARAEAGAGVIPGQVAGSIAEKCRVDLFDLGALGVGARKAGNLAIPLIKQLTQLVAKESAEAARYVHWGATSQDVIDTGLVLELREALGWIDERAAELCEELSHLADAHRTTMVAARTWMQHAVPISYGVKVAGWLDAMVRHRARLREMRRRVLVLQFGGAAGTLSVLGGKGIEVAEELAGDLRLDLPTAPWHAHRDRMAEVATTLALMTGTLGKIARDVSLQMQTEVGEVSEPAGEGRGGSSTMPQKRNPVGCAMILAAAVRVPGLTSTMLSAMPQEHERGLGGWHAEWETLPEVVRLCAGALRWAVEVIGGLEVDVERMKQNLELTHGLIFAEAVAMKLAEKVGKAVAHELLESASRKAIREKKHLRDVLSADSDVSGHIGPKEMAGIFDPTRQLGVADEFIDRVIEASRQLASTPERRQQNSTPSIKQSSRGQARLSSKRRK
jgi:3-carboxy-cis,cis-muconate cycloisomerase